MKIFTALLNTIPRPYLIKISYLVRPFITFFYKGTKFIDPIDGKRFRKLLPYGYGKQRENALSPSTLSLERHRLMWLYLKNETDFFTSKKTVLHIAPEQCFINRFKKLKNLNYTTADLYSPIVDVKADILDLPFNANTFDVLICNHVLEHIEDDNKAMQELYRVLKPNGMGIFQIPQDLSLEKTYEDFSITSPEERNKHFGQYDHVRVYGKDYFNKLRAVGFEVKEVDYSTKITKELIKTYCLIEGEILPICFK